MGELTHHPTETITVVLLDFGGVLADEGFREGLRALAHRYRLEAERIVEIGAEAVYDSGYVTGRGSEADFWKLMSERAGLPPYQPAFTREILTRFLLRPRLLEAVRGLRSRGVFTAILSDQTDWLDWLDNRDHFFSAFDRVFNSFHLGKGKRDPSLFREVVKEIGAPPSQVLFVDDSPGNIGRARAQGLQALLFPGEEKLLTTLAGLGAVGR